MFSWQNILEKSVMPVCVSFREKVTHRHTCTCATGYTLTHPLPQITVTHLHMSADTCNTCKYMHTHTHTHTSALTVPGRQGPAASPALACSQCLLYAILQTFRDAVSWFILRGAAGYQFPPWEDALDSQAVPRTLAQILEGEQGSSEAKQLWKRMRSAGS